MEVPLAEDFKMVGTFSAIYFGILKLLLLLTKVGVVHSFFAISNIFYK